MYSRVLILIPLIIVLIVLNLALDQGNISGNKDANVKKVKVLIYSGSETSDTCVGKVEDCLDKSNSKNLTSNVKFIYNTTNIVDNQTLSSYDVLIMPGSDVGYDYLNSESVDGAAIKNFVASGKGYVGICAGAYSGAKYIDGWYQGWGIAPHVIDEPALKEGNLTVQITPSGKDLFDKGGTQTMPHINGPAMYADGGDTVVFATYQDKNAGYQGYDAIVGDYYGRGRTVLSGVHPELEPEHPEMLADLVLWAANLTSAS